MSKGIIRYNSISSLGSSISSSYSGDSFPSSSSTDSFPSSSSTDSFPSSSSSSFADSVPSSSESNKNENFKFPFDYTNKNKKKVQKLNNANTPSLLSLAKIILNPPYNSSWFETEANLSLKKYLDKLFAISNKYFNTNVNPNTIKAIIVPHAGIKYSGLCSATCYYPLLQRTKPIKRIIIFATYHNKSDNIITTSYTNINPVFGTKKINIDAKSISHIKDFVEINNEAFQEEHSFFNQLPFLEYIEPDSVILPFLISSSMIINKKTNIKLVNLLKTLRQLVDYRSNGVKPNENIVICTSDFSHINGHFEHKIPGKITNNKITTNNISNNIDNSIFYKIRKQDNEILQFVYDKINGVKTRCCKIDDTLFVSNSPSCGAMAMYLFSIFMNMIYDNSYYSSSDSSNSSESDHGSNSSNSSNKIKKLYTRIASYYTSPNRNAFDILNTNQFTAQNLNKYIDLKPSISSISYEGIIFTTQPYLEIGKMRSIENIMTDYEKQCLQTYMKDYLYKQIGLSMPRNVQTINTPVFKMNINVYIILKDSNNKPRYCISSFDKHKEEESTLLSNIRMLVDMMTTTNTTYNDIIFEKLLPEDINDLEFEIYIMGSILPIELSEYYNSKFDIQSDLLMHKTKNTYEYVFAPMEKSVNPKTNKKELFDKLLNLKETDLQNKKYRMANAELFYVECLPI